MIQFIQVEKEVFGISRPAWTLVNLGQVTHIEEEGNSTRIYLSSGSDFVALASYEEIYNMIKKIRIPV